VLTALDAARRAVYLARALLVLYLGLVLVASRLDSALDRRPEDDAWVRAVGAALFILALVHLYCQLVCAGLPGSFGGGLASGSLWMLTFAPLICFVGFLDWHPSALLFAFCGAWAIVIGQGLWLLFLVRLGARLGDEKLRSEGWSFMKRYWCGFLLALVVVSMAVAERPGRSGKLAWWAPAWVGVTGVILLRHYTALLWTATRTVARRAPVRPGR
jgi:hypothetical protein